MRFTGAAVLAVVLNLFGLAVGPFLTGIAFPKSSGTDRHYQLTAHVDIKSVRVGAGWLHRVVEGDVRSAKTDIEYVGASMPYGAWIFDAQASHINDNAYDANGRMGTLRANSNLSKRTAVYGVFAYMKNSGKEGIYSVSAASAVPAAPHLGSNQIGDSIAQTGAMWLCCNSNASVCYARAFDEHEPMGKFKDIDESFNGRHLEREIIVLSVRCYPRYKLSFRDLAEMMAERGLSLAHTTTMHWVKHSRRVRQTLESPGDGSRSVAAR